MHWKEQLRLLAPYCLAEKIDKLPDDPREAWYNHNNYERFTWAIADLIEPQSIEHRRLVGMFCRGVRQVIDFVPEEDARLLRALELTERWTKGDETVAMEMLISAYIDASLTASHAYNTASYVTSYVADAVETTARYAVYTQAYLAAESCAETAYGGIDDLRTEFTFDEIKTMWERHFNQAKEGAVNAPQSFS